MSLGTGRRPPSPCTGSMSTPAVSGPMAAFRASRSANGTWSKPGVAGPKPSRYFCLPAGRDGRQRAAVEGALEGDQPVALRDALGEMPAARRLDGAFERLGAGVREEHAVRERILDQPPAQRLLPRDLVEVGDVPQLAGLLGERLDQMRMGMAERVHRDPRGEVEILRPVGGIEPRALPALEREVGPRECGV